VTLPQVRVPDSSTTQCEVVFAIKLQLQDAGRNRLVKRARIWLCCRLDPKGWAVAYTAVVQCFIEVSGAAGRQVSRSHKEERRQTHVFANYRRESHITGRPKRQRVGEKGSQARSVSPFSIQSYEFGSVRSEPQDCRDSPFAPLQRSRRDVWKTRHRTQSYGSRSLRDSLSD
jgi:hypothetical protein